MLTHRMSRVVKKTPTYSEYNFQQQRNKEASVVLLMFSVDGVRTVVDVVCHIGLPATSHRHLARTRTAITQQLSGACPVLLINAFLQFEFTYGAS